MDARTTRIVARALLAGCARTVLVTLAGLLVWSVLPLALGWQPTVVMSGSMEPRIMTGDVVVTRQVPAAGLRVGQVLRVDDPAHPGRELLHRYDHATADGDLVLRGDANAHADSTPVAPAHVHGVGVLRIPWIGRPAVWAAQGRYLPLTLVGLVLITLLSAARIPSDRADADPPTPPGADGPPMRPAGPGEAERASASDREAPVAAATLATAFAVALLVGVGTPASAVFTDATHSAATFTAAPQFERPSPAWVQPTGAHDAYPAGAVVSYQGGVYRSVINANVWSPSEYPPGWERID
ncbi:hypothetical protein [Brachybacterium kimchii]|uniref:Signal peptidase I n=1 Tax=Brachybacterium kimchii TaxID=2942909 RepID=A0ABY4N0J6_9MICO|nr:hypothetical protein [Brachybacterium kimchii]UQN28079.1 hypothetical protein M4486_10475 [Brachybacterium kimchii]